MQGQGSTEMSGYMAKLNINIIFLTNDGVFL